MRWRKVWIMCRLYRLGSIRLAAADARQRCRRVDGHVAFLPIYVTQDKGFLRISLDVLVVCLRRCDNSRL